MADQSGDNGDEMYVDSDGKADPELAQAFQTLAICLARIEDQAQDKIAALQEENLDLHEEVERLRRQLADAAAAARALDAVLRPPNGPGRSTPPPPPPAP